MNGKNGKNGRNGRRVRASILLLVQFMCFTAIVRMHIDFVGPVLLFWTWSNHTYLWILTLSIQSTRQFTHMLLTTYPYITAIRNILSAIPLLVTVLFNGVCVILILIPAIPIVCILIGLLGGIYMALKTLITTLIAEHKPRQKYKGNTQNTQNTARAPAESSSPSAYKIYAFERGWHIEILVAENLSVSFRSIRLWWFNIAALLTDWEWMRNGFIVYWLRLIKAGCLLAGLTQYVLSVEFGGLVTCLYITILLLWEAGVLFCSAFFLVPQTVCRRLRGIVLHCPACYKDIYIPIYLCPTCQAEFTQLQPGVYGVFAQQCLVCDTKLPTLHGQRRQNLARLCPHCHSVLSRGIGQGTDIQIALVGDSSAGKTTYLLAAIHKLVMLSMHQDSVSFTFLDALLEERVQQLKNGDKPLPTTEMIPQAYALKMQRASTSTPRIIYFYDPGGNVFSSATTIAQQDYYRYIHGFLFIIDSLTLQFEAAMGEPAHPSPLLGALKVMQIYERMMQKFEAAYGMNKQKRYSQPIAIILTKTHMHNLTHEIGISALQKSMTDDPIYSEPGTMSQLVRTFLASRGLTPFMRDVEAQFKCVEYFACSVDDAFPQTRNALASSPLPVLPILHPLHWLLEHTGR